MNDNIEDISHDLPEDYLEGKAFYNAQEFMEEIHKEFYGTQIETIIQDPLIRHKLLLEASTSSFIQEKIQLSTRRRGSNVPLAERIIANGCVEAIGFSSLFAAVIWLKTINKMPGTTFGNEEVIVDESIHVEGSTHIYKDLQKMGFISNLSESTIHDIVQDFVNTEIYCAGEILGEGEGDLNIDNMTKYIKFVADFYCTKLGYNKIYNVKNPYPFMDMTALMTKSNFFEKRVAEYKHLQTGDTNMSEVKTDLSIKF